MDKLNLHRIPSQPLIHQGQSPKIGTKPETIVSRTSEQSGAACRTKNKQTRIRTFGRTKHPYIGCGVGACH